MRPDDAMPRGEATRRDDAMPHEDASPRRDPMPRDGTLPGGEELWEAAEHVTLHLLPAARWEAWRADADPAARYVPAGFETEGFVHCTDGDEEMLAVANRFYAAEPGDVVVVDLDLARVGASWRYDDPGSPYPHVYGALRRDAVRSVRRVLRDPAGHFVGYGERRPA